MTTKTAVQQQQAALSCDFRAPPMEQAVRTARPRREVNWDDLRRDISAEWRETLDFLAD